MTTEVKNPSKALRTSIIAALIDKTSSGAFLTSSINSGPEASTIHLRNVAILNKDRFDWESGRRVSSDQRKVPLRRNEIIYLLVPTLEHGRAIEDETKSGEVRKNRVRESDGRNDSELRTTQLGQ
jgi:hypothetical protein